MMPSLFLPGLLIAMAASLATLAAVSLLRRDRRRYGPTFRRICRSLRVTSAERRRLQRLARRARVPCAASLLISRGYFDAAVTRGASGEDVRRLDSVRRRVFV